MKNITKTIIGTLALVGLYDMGKRAGYRDGVDECKRLAQVAYDTATAIRNKDEETE